MKAKQLRQLRDELIRDLDLDKSATTETVCIRLCHVMAHRLQRDIKLRFDDLGGGGLSGLWAVTDNNTHVIIVTTTRSWVHRLHIVLHELAHMICGHTPARLDAEEGARLLYPDLSPRMLTTLASRTDMSRRDEREADRVAGTLARGLIEWARQQDIEPFQPEDDGHVTRAWYTFGFSSQRGQQ